MPHPGLAGRAVRANSPPYLILTKVARDELDVQSGAMAAEIAAGLNIRNLLVVALVHNGLRLGALQLADKIPAAEKAAQARQAAAANAQRAEAERARQAAAAESERALKEAADLRAELERLRGG